MDRTQAPDPTQPNDIWLDLTLADYKALSPQDRRALHVKREHDKAEARRKESKTRAEADRKRRAEQQTERDAEQQVAAEAREVAQLQRSYLRANPSATEADFEAVKGDLLRKARGDAALDASRRDRARMRKHVSSRLV